MKKALIYLSLCAGLICGCTDGILDELDKSNKTLEDKIEANADRISDLERRCEEMNSSLEAMSKAVTALQANDFIKSITPVYDTDGVTVLGYVISFVKSGDIRIFTGRNGKDGKDGADGKDGNPGKDGADGQDGKDGVDGHSPAVGVAKDSDGIWYWTVDGEWMKDSSGDRIRAGGVDGTTPRFRITDGYWEISYDDGDVWTRLGAATGSDGESFFKDLTWSDKQVTMTLSDGTVLTIPRYQSPVLKLSIEDNETGADSGIDVLIDYSITGAADDISLSASSDGNYAVKVIRTNSTSGQLLITPPTPYCDGFVNVVLTDGSGFSQVQVINFHQNIVSFSHGLEYQIPSDGGEVTIPFSLNFGYSVRTDSDWLTLSGDTKSEMNDRSVTASASKNELFCSRQAIIQVFAMTNPSQPYAEITVIQASAYFSLSQSKFAVPYTGGEVSADIWSSLGLKCSSDGAASWMKFSVSETGDNGYNITATLDRNTSGAKRFARIRLLDQSGTTVLGYLEIVQLSEYSDSPDDIVFAIRATVPNDFTCELPLSGQIDCYVDWGDGSVEYYSASPVTHKYNVTEPQSFTVRVSGTVTSLNSSDITAPSITEVKQWGNTGLTDMNNAFVNNTLLRHVADNTTDSFAGVCSFDAAFNSCINLQEIPENLFSGCTAAQSFCETFTKCVSLSSIPAGLFSNCPNVLSFLRTFSYCNSLKTLPAGLFSGCSTATSFDYTFSECKSLESISGELFKGCINARSFRYCFNSCSALKSIPESLFRDCTEATDIFSIFNNCSALHSVPAKLFDNNIKLRNMAYAFISCRNLAGESPYSIIGGKKVHLYERNSYPDYFSAVVEIGGLFADSWYNFDDRDLIPEVCKN